MPKRTQILWSTRNSAISSADAVGDSGGNSLAITEKKMLNRMIITIPDHAPMRCNFSSTAGRLLAKHRFRGDFAESFDKFAKTDGEQTREVICAHGPACPNRAQGAHA